MAGFSKPSFYSGVDDLPFSNRDQLALGELRGHRLSLLALSLLFLRTSKLSDPRRSQPRALPGLASPGGGGREELWSGQALGPLLLGWVIFAVKSPRLVAGLSGCEGDRQGPGFSRQASGPQATSPTLRKLGSHGDDKSPGFHSLMPQLSGHLGLRSATKRRGPGFPSHTGAIAPHTGPSSQ